jgi:hypothetical protein
MTTINGEGELDLSLLGVALYECHPAGKGGGRHEWIKYTD